MTAIKKHCCIVRLRASSANQRTPRQPCRDYPLAKIKSRVKMNALENARP
jgi:hypothetical protein